MWLGGLSPQHIPISYLMQQITRKNKTYQNVKECLENEQTQYENFSLQPLTFFGVTSAHRTYHRCPRWSLGMIHKEVACPKGKLDFSFQTFIFRGENVNFREVHSYELLGCLMTGSFITRMACSCCTPVPLSYQNPP